MAAHRLLACLLVLALAACGSVPRPFAHDPDAPVAGLARLTSGTGVAVLGGGPAAEDFSVALRALDIPATPLDAPREGGYVLRPGAEGGWDLLSPTERLLLVVPPGQDLAEAAETVAHAVETDALRPVTLRMGPPSTDSPASTPTAAALPPLRVPPVAGLEAGRARVLAGAVSEALRRGGLPVADDGTAASAAWTVAGRFETGRAEAGEPVPVRLVWTLVDAAGRDHGSAEQANAVPAEVLERGFAALAAAIASGAAEGIAALAFEALAFDSRSR